MNSHVAESDDKRRGDFLVKRQTETEGCHVTLDLLFPPFGVNGLKGPLVWLRGSASEPIRKSLPLYSIITAQFPRPARTAPHRRLI